MLGDFLSGLLRDIGSFLRDAVWNYGIAVYSGVVLVWGILAELHSCLRGPEGFVGLLVIGALIVGAFMAYRTAREDWLWDHSALQVEHSVPVENPEQPPPRRYQLGLEIVATKTIPSPTRIRLLLSSRPTAIEAEVQTMEPKVLRATLLDTKKGFAVKVRGCRAYLKFPSPGFTISNRQLLISVFSSSPLEYRSVAAYRQRD